MLEGVAYQSDIEFPVSLAPVQVLSAAQLDGVLNQMVGAMKEKIPELELRGTGMKLQRVSTLELQMARFKPLKGSSFFPLPEALAAKKAIVNVQNKDQECFKWAVLSALFPAPHMAQRVGHYLKHQEKIDWSGLTFPVQMDKIALFGRRNSVSVNVYGCDVKKGCCSPYPLRLSKMTEAAKHIDLLLLENAEGQSHYCWIKISAGLLRIHLVARSTTAGTAYMASLPRRNWKSTQRMDAARLLRRDQFCLSPAVKQRSFSSRI